MTEVVNPFDDSSSTPAYKDQYSTLSYRRAVLCNPSRTKAYKKRTSYSKPKYPIVAFLSPILDMVTWQALYQPFSTTTAQKYQSDTCRRKTPRKKKKKPQKNLQVQSQDPEPGYRMLCIERETKPRPYSCLVSRKKCGLKLRSWRQNTVLQV